MQLSTELQSPWKQKLAELNGEVYSSIIVGDFNNYSQEEIAQYRKSAGFKRFEQNYQSTCTN